MFCDHRLPGDIWNAAGGGQGQGFLKWSCIIGKELIFLAVSKTLTWSLLEDRGWNCVRAQPQPASQSPWDTMHLSMLVAECIARCQVTLDGCLQIVWKISVISVSKYNSVVSMVSPLPFSTGLRLSVGCLQGPCFAHSLSLAVLGVAHRLKICWGGKDTPDSS